jgi:hypothetical protein
MSADAWSACPRCAARDDFGLRGYEFREDYEIGQDEGVVSVRYSGECQRCGLSVTFEQEYPIPGFPEVTPGPRTEQARPMTWGTVPAGWYVQAPDGRWYRVVQTMSPVHTMQRVTLDIAGTHREWDRAAAGPVTACPGPPNVTDDALKVLGYPEILEDGS